MSTLLALLAVADIDLSLRFTHTLRGAHMPVNSQLQQCDSVDSCSCTGGAHRRQAYLGSGRGDNVVAIDTGSYASGSGKQLKHTSTWKPPSC